MSTTQTQTGNITDKSTDNLLKALTAKESPELTMEEKAALYDQFKEDYCDFSQDLQCGDINSLMRFRFAYDELNDNTYIANVIRAINKQIQALVYAGAIKDLPDHHLDNLINIEDLCALSTFLANIEEAVKTLSPEIE